MNWYKKIASYNLNFPNDLYSQIENITKKLVSTLYNLSELPSQPIFMGKINFINPYNQQAVSSNIYLNNQTVDNDNGTAAKRDRKTGDIYINVYKDFLTPQMTPEYDVANNRMYNHLLHEIAHEIDPKIYSLNKQYNMMEHLKPTEFDAYSKEITNSFRKAFTTPENKKILQQYIMGNSFGEFDTNIQNIININPYSYIIMQAWKREKPEYIRTLRIRLYNEVISENNKI